MTTGRRINKDVYTVARFEAITTGQQVDMGEIMYLRGDGSVTPESNPFNVFTGNVDDRITSNIITRDDYPAWDDNAANIAADWVLLPDNNGYYRWSEARGMSPFTGFGRGNYNNILINYLSEDDRVFDSNLRTTPICWDEISKFEKAINGVSLVNEISLNIFDDENRPDLINQRYVYDFDEQTGLLLTNGYNSSRQATSLAYYNKQKIGVTIQNFENKATGGDGVQTLTLGNDQSITLDFPIVIDGITTDIWSMEVFIEVLPSTTVTLLGDASTDYHVRLHSDGTLSMKYEGGYFSTTAGIPLNQWQEIRFSRLNQPVGVDNYSINIVGVEFVDEVKGSEYAPYTLNTIVEPNIFTGKIRNIRAYDYDSNFNELPYGDWALDEPFATDETIDSFAGNNGTRNNIVQDDIEEGTPPVVTPSVRTLFDADPINKAPDPDDDTKRIHLAIDADGNLFSETPDAIEKITSNGVDVALGDYLDPNIKQVIEVTPALPIVIVTRVGMHRDGDDRFSGYLYDFKLIDECYEVIYPLNDYGLVNQRRQPNKTHFLSFLSGYKQSNWTLINK